MVKITTNFPPFLANLSKNHVSSVAHIIASVLIQNSIAVEPQATHRGQGSGVKIQNSIVVEPQATSRWKVEGGR